VLEYATGCRVKARHDKQKERLSLHCCHCKEPRVIGATKQSPRATCRSGQNECMVPKGIALSRLRRTVLRRLCWNTPLDAVSRHGMTNKKNGSLYTAVIASRGPHPNPLLKERERPPHCLPHVSLRGVPIHRGDEGVPQWCRSQ